MAPSADNIFRQAIASFQAGQLNDAERHFKKVLRHQPQHVAALNLLSVLLARLEKYTEAEAYILSALKLNSNSDATLYNYGIILKALKRPFEALERFSQALSINPSVADTWNNRGTVLNDLKRYDDAVADFDRAIALQPNYPEAFCNKGNSLADLKRHGEAFAAYGKATALRPDFADPWLGCGNVLVELKRYDDAVSAYDKALALRPDLANAWLGRGNVFSKLKRHDEALSAYDKALALKPDLAESWLGRGNIFFDLTRHDDALAAFDKALALKPDLANAWLGRGNVFFALRRHDDAIAAYDKALALKPDLAEAWLGRGTVFFDLRWHDNAFAAYDKALALKPDLADAWLGRGNTFYELRRHDDAFAAYDKALALKSDLAEAWLGRGNVFDKRQRHEEAAAAYAKVLEIDPQFPFTKGLILHQKMHACDWNGLDDLIADIDRDVAAGKRSAEPFGYQAAAHSARNFRLCAEIFAADKFPRSKTPVRGDKRYDYGKIRVGYLSGEFRNHVTSRLMTGLFECHDKNRFELFAFDNGWDDGSELRGRINKAFDAIVDISRLDDRQAAAMIEQKQIDILVNLNGYFGDGRTRVFGYKPSPIQVSYLGFSATMGTDYIDYIIADRYIIPPEHEAFYTESVVCLPDTFQVNDSKRQTAMRNPDRAEFKLPATGFTFCCFNNNFKITPDIFDVWMRLLNKVDDSVLWLQESNPAVSRNLRAAAQHRGVAPERLVFASHANEYSDYLARYRAADLFLDTLPFNAGGTASDALWTGLPLLTCSGQTYTARMAGSLLKAIGLPELITQSLDDYESLALKLARDPALLASIKAKLARNRDTYPLFDTARFAHHIEAAYAIMWERHRRGERPESFSVDP